IRLFRLTKPEYLKHQPLIDLHVEIGRHLVPGKRIPAVSEGGDLLGKRQEVTLKRPWQNRRASAQEISELFPKIEGVAVSCVPVSRGGCSNMRYQSSRSGKYRHRQSPRSHFFVS